MGYYIEGPAHGKAQYIVDNYGGTIVGKAEARADVDTFGVIVVIDNGPFEAAGYAYSTDEFDEFTRPSDPRPKQFVIMDKAKAEQLSGFAPSSEDEGDSDAL